MIVIPFSIKQGMYSLMFVLEQDSIDRIKEYDPAQINLQDLTEPFRSMKLDEIHITFGNKEDMAFVMSQEQGVEGLKKVLQHLTRGWKFRPELGDNDSGPQMPVHN